MVKFASLSWEEVYMAEKITFTAMSTEEISNLKGKYFLNGSTLHIIGKCHHTKHMCKPAKIFDSEDDAIASETRYMKYCKLCFKD